MHIFETLMGMHVHGSMLPFFERKMLDFLIIFFLSIVTKSTISDHHLRCGGWLNF